MPTIELEPLCHDGYDDSYLTRGHVDKSYFLAAVQAMNTHLGVEASHALTLSDVQHTYCCEVSEEQGQERGWDAGGYLPVPAHHPGAIAVTYLVLR